MLLIPLDLLNLLDGWLGRLLDGPMHRFTFSTVTGKTGGEVEMLLRQYGVRIWGREAAAEDELAFLVKYRQAKWAEYVLCRAGVPLTCQLLDPRNEHYRQRHPAGSMPSPWDERGIRPHTFVDHTVDWLNRLLG
jgi:hypothetical protein